MECMILSAIVVSLTAAHLNKKWSSVNAHSKVSIIWDKVFKNGPSKICGRQPLKSLKGYGLLMQTISLQTF